MTLDTDDHTDSALTVDILSVLEDAGKYSWRLSYRHETSPATFLLKLGRATKATWLRHICLSEQMKTQKPDLLSVVVHIIRATTSSIYCANVFNVWVTEMKRWDLTDHYQPHVRIDASHHLEIDKYFYAKSFGLLFPNRKEGHVCHVHGRSINLILCIVLCNFYSRNRLVANR